MVVVVSNINCYVEVISFSVRYTDPQIRVPVEVGFIEAEGYDNDISATLSSQRNFENFFVLGTAAKTNCSVFDSARGVDERCLGADIFMSYRHFPHFTEALAVGDNSE